MKKNFHGTSNYRTMSDPTIRFELHDKSAHPTHYVTRRFACDVCGEAVIIVGRDDVDVQARQVDLARACGGILTCARCYSLGANKGNADRIRQPGLR